MYTHTYIHTERGKTFTLQELLAHLKKKSKHKLSDSYRQLTKIGRSLVIHDLKTA